VLEECKDEDGRQFKEVGRLGGIKSFPGDEAKFVGE